MNNAIPVKSGGVTACRASRVLPLGDGFGLDLAVPVGFRLAPALVGQGALPVAGGMERGGGDATVGDQMAAGEADRGGLAVEEDLRVAGRELERGDRLGQPFVAVAVQPV